MIYESTAIIHVGEAGLEYVDEYEDIRFINFEVCGQKAAEFYQSPEGRICVAHQMIHIDAAGNIQPVIEFFTWPPTRFSVESEEQLAGLRFRIEQMGWQVR